MMQYYIMTDDTAIGPFVSRVVASQIATTDLPHYLTEKRYEIKGMVFVKFDNFKGTFDWPLP